ncbi:hypothetical protein C8R44DRAFT_733657 [Mycena epipterygia]|nr:hypothetical protein C8R44DRAFT_733657 [Mycena epipterygia]
MDKERADDKIYTTISATARLESSERARRRTLTYPVGRKLIEFSSTRQLVQALKDAIKVMGMFFSSITPQTWSILPSSLTWITAEDLEGIKEAHPHLFKDKVLDTLKSLKDRTGAFKFLAIELTKSVHNPPAHHKKHDLESFYWLLLCLLRHTNHTTFSITRAAWAKQGWIATETFHVPGNPPISLKVSEIFEAQSKCREPVQSSHRSVVAAFDKAFKDLEGWLDADASEPFVPPSANRDIREEITTQTGGNQSASGESRVSESPAQSPSQTGERKRLASVAAEGTAKSTGSSKKRRKAPSTEKPDIRPKTRSKSTTKKAGISKSCSIVLTLVANK